MNASDNRFYREPGDRKSAERDLTIAIHEQIKSPESVRKALDLWQHRRIGPDDAADMWALLATISEDAIEVVLARRQHEAARTGPWEVREYEAPRDPAEQLKIRGVGRVADEPRALLVLLSERPTDDEIRSLHDYLKAARTGPWDRSMLAGTNPGDTPAGTGKP